LRTHRTGDGAGEFYFPEQVDMRNAAEVNFCK
jgi:hypothetical protein